MIYIFDGHNQLFSNYIPQQNGILLDWVDLMQDSYRSVVLYRLGLPKSWVKTHQNRYCYKSLSNIWGFKENHKTLLRVTEDGIVLLHPPATEPEYLDLLQLIQHPLLQGKDWWLIGHAKFNYLEEIPALGELPHTKIENFAGFLNQVQRDILLAKILC